MGSFTKVYMSPTFPESSGLDSIGSVAANFARTDEEEKRIEFIRFSCGSAHADLIHAMHGIAAHENFLEETRLKNEAEARRRTEQLARRKARSAAFKRAYHRLTALFAK